MWQEDNQESPDLPTLEHFNADAGAVGFPPAGHTFWCRVDLPEIVGKAGVPSKPNHFDAVAASTMRRGGNVRQNVCFVTQHRVSKLLVAPILCSGSPRRGEVCVEEGSGRNAEGEELPNR